MKRFLIWILLGIAFLAGSIFMLNPGNVFAESSYDDSTYGDVCYPPGCPADSSSPASSNGFTTSSPTNQTTTQFNNGSSANSKVTPAESTSSNWLLISSLGLIALGFLAFLLLFLAKRRKKRNAW